MVIWEAATPTLTILTITTETLATETACIPHPSNSRACNSQSRDSYTFPIPNTYKSIQSPTHAPLIDHQKHRFSHDTRIRKPRSARTRGSRARAFFTGRRAMTKTTCRCGEGWKKWHKSLTGTSRWIPLGSSKWKGHNQISARHARGGDSAVLHTSEAFLLTRRVGLARGLLWGLPRLTPRPLPTRDWGCTISRPYRELEDCTRRDASRRLRRTCRVNFVKSYCTP